MIEQVKKNILLVGIGIGGKGKSPSPTEITSECSSKRALNPSRSLTVRPCTYFKMPSISLQMASFDRTAGFLSSDGYTKPTMFVSRSPDNSPIFSLPCKVTGTAVGFSNCLLWSFHYESVTQSEQAVDHHACLHGNSGFGSKKPL